jgi:hypothetical protein
MSGVADPFAGETIMESKLVKGFGAVAENRNRSKLRGMVNSSREE